MAAAPDPYAELLALGELELEHAGAGRYDALAEIAARRDAIIGELPPIPPAHVRSTLELAALTQERVTIELLRGRERTLLDLGLVAQARRTARGYGRSIATVRPPGGPHVDTSA